MKKSKEQIVLWIKSLCTIYKKSYPGDEVLLAKSYDELKNIHLEFRSQCELNILPYGKMNYANKFMTSTNKYRLSRRKGKV